VFFLTSNHDELCCSLNRLDKWKRHFFCFKSKTNYLLLKRFYNFLDHKKLITLVHLWLCDFKIELEIYWFLILKICFVSLCCFLHFVRMAQTIAILLHYILRILYIFHHFISTIPISLYLLNLSFKGVYFTLQKIDWWIKLNYFSKNNFLFTHYF
jgi:hypothetical protein